MQDQQHAHDHLHSLLWGFAAHRVITVAGRLGLLNALAVGPKKSIEEIARQCHTALLPTGKVVRALVALDLVVADEDKYGMSDAMAAFFDPTGLDMTPFLYHSHNIYDNFGAHLEDWVKSGEWPRQPRTEKEIAAFGDAMFAMGTYVATQMAEIIDLTGVKSVLDVGGGVGQFSEALLNKSSNLSATVLDIEPVVAQGAKRIENSNLSERLSFIAGDYMSLPSSRKYDLVLFANVLHQESESRAEQMIREGAKVLNHGGRIAVLDLAIDEQKQKRVVGALFAINMRSFGDTYPQSVIENWLQQVGLVNLTKQDVGAHRFLITGQLKK